jgi:excisionase family DNA binding protein
VTAKTNLNDAWREPGEALLSIAELAAYLGVPVATIYRWRHEHQGPVGYRIGRYIRYRARDIEEWLEIQRDCYQDPASGT